MRVHTIHRMPPAQPTHFICVLIGKCNRRSAYTFECAYLCTSAYTYLINVQGQAGKQSISTLIQITIS